MNKVKIYRSGYVMEVKDVQRGRVELLQNRLELLSGKDKVLMTMYIINGNSFRQIARILDVSETSVSRRIHQLSERLTNGEFLTCVRNRGKLNRRQLAIARDSFLMGLSNRQIARKRGMSLYAVRKELAGIRNLNKRKEAGNESILNSNTTSGIQHTKYEE